MSAASRLALFAACAALVASPRLAEACPTCAGAEPGGSARIVALGAMILLPFAIAFAVWQVLRPGDDRGPDEGRDGNP